MLFATLRSRTEVIVMYAGRCSFGGGKRGGLAVGKRCDVHHYIMENKLCVQQFGIRVPRYGFFFLLNFFFFIKNRRLLNSLFEIQGGLNR